MIQFLTANVPVGERVQAHDLHASYLQWCSVRGLPPLSETMFFKKLPTMGRFRKSPSRGRIYWVRTSPGP